MSGAEAHYEDAGYYDQAYRRRREDVRFYAGLAAALGEGGSVLELGCGTGRVSLAMAEHVDVVGVDAMPAMLERARARLAKKPKRIRARLSLHQGDLRSFRARRKFPLVVAPFNVFNHLYTRSDFERAIATVKAHLAPGGLFVFDIRLPDARELARDPDRVYRVGQVVRGTGDARRKVFYRERFEYDPVTQIQTIDMAFVGVDDPLHFEITPLTQRHYFPAELEALLAYNGLAIEERHGDFEGNELDEVSDSQILFCRRA